MSDEVTAHRVVVDRLLARLDEDDAGDSLVETMLEAAGPDSDRQSALADVIGTIARRLAPEDDAPIEPRAASVWRALVTTADRLYGSGVARIGRLPFVSDRLIALMVEEARQALRNRPRSGSRIAAEGGPALAGLAVSAKLQAVVAAAIGHRVVPAYRALYAYDPPGSHVRTHVDSQDFEVIVHMVLEHRRPGNGSSGSGLVAHLPGSPLPARVWLDPGEGVVLCGRGTIHSWQRLQRDEWRTLVDIGWARA